MGFLTRPTAAQQLIASQKRILLIFLSGGLSQFESWDPKPGVDTGGPFAAIPTSVPGIHISELLPNTAQQMHHMLLVRGINTREGEHDRGEIMMRTGRDITPGAEFPQLGAVVAKAMEEQGAQLPGNVLAGTSAGARSTNSAYLGPRYGSISVGGPEGLVNSGLPTGVTVAADGQRHAWRRAVNDRYLRRRHSSDAHAYTESYEQALELMQRRAMFDITKESAADQHRYGKGHFGQSLLLARRLLEHNVPFVEVGHGNYDTHANNFNFHIEHLREFDAYYPLMMADLAERGMLETTLVVVMTEFGRSPKINPAFGREHWGLSWSMAMAGCGLSAGAVYGKTNAKGTEVIDGQVDHRQLFHTYLQAVGIDSASEFVIDGRSYPVADPAIGPIKELLT
ncbi:MAG: DUF1501 domain-containing protein, partial [Planctomycetota bacterium]|nr:DUF1501 domain-containing protein [Planctomycetota bacterium]